MVATKKPKEIAGVWKVNKKFYDFPKLHSPFVRTMKGKKYITIDEIPDDMKWVFEDETVAVEKLHGCLHSSQSILTDKGLIKIGHIVNDKLSVKVASYNFEKRIVEFKKIEHYHKAKRVGDMICVSVRSRNHGQQIKNIVCTPNHKFWSNGKWVKAENLKSKDKLSHRATTIPKGVKQIILGGLVETEVINISKSLPKKCSGGVQPNYEYDIKVKDNSNYFTNEILVHNTCCAIVIDYGVVIAMFNRTNRLPFIGGTLSKAMTQGVNNALKKNRFALVDGIYWGELIGPKIQKNEYNLEENEWVPFNWLKEHCRYKCWGKYPKTHESISKWFKELMPLYAMKKGNKEGFVEGIVFTHPSGKMAKLRKDMFDWHSGEPHKGEIKC